MSTSLVHAELPGSPADQSSYSRVVYALCIGRTRDLDAPSAVVGFEPDQPLSVVRSGTLSAVAIEMDAAYLVGPDAERRLADLDWVAPRAVRHEELIRDAMNRGPVMPLPFGTAFSSTIALRERLGASRDVIETFLVRVERSVEYGVRIAFDRDAMLEAVSAQRLAAADAPPGPGARYLLAKRIREESARQLVAHVDSMAASIIDALRPIADEVVRRRAVADRGDGLETAACAALLISRDRADLLAQRIASLRQEHRPMGVNVELTGPWPPYSFCPALGTV